MTAYYNEFDKQKAEWLRALIAEGQIAPGFVDTRSIHDVQPGDLHDFTQCHFFAGIGVWSYALRRAGWPDDRPVWTGSCPCGPFSIAGEQKGFDDPRHLWPEWFRLIRVGRPDVLFGEQSDEADAWLDLVSSDLEGDGYAVGAADVPAAGFSGAHRRQRLYFVADANDAERWAERAPWHDGFWPKTGRVQGHGHAGDGRASIFLGHADGESAGRNGAGLPGAEAFGERAWLELGRISDGPWDAGDPDRVDAGVAQGDTGLAGLPDAQYGIVRRPGWGPEGRAVEQPGDSLRAGVDWLWCRDRVWRPVESGTCPLVDQAPVRMGRLRGYGDAIDAEVATQFIGVFLEARGDLCPI